MNVNVDIAFRAPTAELDQHVRDAFGYKSDLAAGIDLAACVRAPITLDPLGAPALIPTGLAMRIGDPGWMAAVLPRSGAGHRRGLIMGNGTGVIDADYTGEIMISAWNRNADAHITIAPGERIAQLVLLPIGRIRAHETDALTPTDRGAGGFSSTGT